MPGSEAALRRARLLRRHRRPRVQEDLPRAAGDGAPGPARLPGRRRGEVGLDARAARRAGAGQRHRVRRRRRRGGLRQARAAAPLRRRRLQRRRHLRRGSRPSSSGAQRPAHYLAIPPSMFPTVVEQPRPRRAAPTNARVIVEKPFGRDLDSARGAERHPARGLPRGEHLPHRPLPRQGGGPEHPLLPLRQRLPRADLEPPLRRERADHDGRELRREGPRQVLRGDRRHPRRHPEPPAADRQLPRHGGAVVARTTRPSATSRPRCCARCGR